MAFIPFSFRSIANIAERGILLKTITAAFQIQRRLGRGGIIEGDNHSIANTAERGVRSINSNLSTN
jgi:hypothetical protein